ncbi:hypothetical protein GW17_00041051 [Ensete ventricosum]|nr:hypothetical protein GW17_00041051 [Ensete ventricosum]
MQRKTSRVASSARCQFSALIAEGCGLGSCHRERESPWDGAIDAIKRKGSLTRSGLSRRTKGKQKIARNGRKGGIRRGGIGGEEGGVRMGFRDREAFRGFLGDRFPVLGGNPFGRVEEL